MEMELKPGMMLIRKVGKMTKPQVVQVDDQDINEVYLVRLVKENSETFLMHKLTIPEFYRHLEEGEQVELFGKTITMVDELKEKHLRAV